MILDICDNADIMSILRIIKIAILIIRIIVPILLIVSLALNYMNAVKSNDADMLSKANKASISKIIAAILVFMIPTFVHLLANLIGDDSYVHCIDIATVENINSARERTAKTRIDKVKESLELSDYQVALSEINKIKDNDIKTAMMSDLDKIHEYVLLNQEINKLIKNYNKDKYTEILNKINNISDSAIKEKLSKKLEESGVGKPINANAGAERGNYNGVDYYQILPDNPTTNLPMIVFLHGDGELGNVEKITNCQIFNYVKSKAAYEAGDFIFLAPLRPTSEYATSTNITKTKSVIDYIADKYQVDMDRIAITGMSGGAILTWGMVSAYPDYFSCTMPMSCGPAGANAENFKTTPVYSISGTVAVESSYKSQMESFVNKINSLGGNARHVTYQGDSHGTIQNRYRDVELFKWMLSNTKKR